MKLDACSVGGENSSEPICSYTASWMTPTGGAGANAWGTAVSPARMLLSAGALEACAGTGGCASGTASCELWVDASALAVLTTAAADGVAVVVSAGGEMEGGVGLSVGGVELSTGGSTGGAA